MKAKIDIDGNIVLTPETTAEHCVLHYHDIKVVKEEFLPSDEPVYYADSSYYRSWKSHYPYPNNMNEINLPKHTIDCSDIINTYNFKVKNNLDDGLLQEESNRPMSAKDTI